MDIFFGKRLQDIDNRLCLFTASWLIFGIISQDDVCNGEKMFLCLVLLSSSIVIYGCMMHALASGSHGDGSVCNRLHVFQTVPEKLCRRWYL